jgi:ATP-dependent DNA ligase
VRAAVQHFQRAKHDQPNCCPMKPPSLKPVNCLPAAKIPVVPDWSYELKLYGYRLEAVRNKRQAKLYSGGTQLQEVGIAGYP